MKLLQKNDTTFFKHGVVITVKAVLATETDIWLTKRLKAQK